MKKALITGITGFTREIVICRLKLRQFNFIELLEPIFLNTALFHGAGDGSYLAELLLEKGYEICTISRRNCVFRPRFVL